MFTSPINFSLIDPSSYRCRIACARARREGSRIGLNNGQRRDWAGLKKGDLTVTFRGEENRQNKGLSDLLLLQGDRNNERTRDRGINRELGRRTSLLLSNFLVPESTVKALAVDRLLSAHTSQQLVGRDVFPWLCGCR